MSELNRPHVRIKGDGYTTKVELVDLLGNVTDLSSFVTRVEFTAQGRGERELPSAVIDVQCPVAEFEVLMGNVRFNVAEPGA